MRSCENSCLFPRTLSLLPMVSILEVPSLSLLVFRFLVIFSRCSHPLDNYYVPCNFFCFEVSSHETSPLLLAVHFPLVIDCKRTSHFFASTRKAADGWKRVPSCWLYVQDGDCLQFKGSYRFKSFSLYVYFDGELVKVAIIYSFPTKWYEYNDMLFKVERIYRMRLAPLLPLLHSPIISLPSDGIPIDYY